MDKTQHQVENEYYYIDLPELLERKDEIKAAEMLKNIEVSSFPYISDENTRKAIVKQYSDRLPKPEPEPPKSAEEQYQALIASMKVGG